MRKGSLIADIAQILILILVLPLVFAIIDAKSLMDFIGGVPIFDTWTGILYSYATIDTSSLVLVYTNSFFEAIILGVCVNITNGIGTAIGARGLPILSTFLGIFVGTFLIKLLGVAGGFQTLLYIALMLIGISLMVKGVFRGLKLFSGTSIFTLLVNSILAVIMTGYVVALTLFSQGVLPLVKLLTVTGCAILALIIAYWVDRFC